MDERKITVSIIVFTGVLILLGFVIWLFIRPQPSTSSPQPQTQNQPLGGGNNQSVTEIPQPQAERPPDLKQEYRVLFEKLRAQELTFKRVASSSGELGSVYALYADDIKEYKTLFPKQTDLSMRIASIDLNSDGVSEAVVYEDLAGYCGTAGCALDIYQKEGSEWKSILGMLTHEAVGVSSSKTNGYSNLYFTLHGAIGFQSNVVEFVWIDGRYQPFSTVAQWDGATFRLMP